MKVETYLSPATPIPATVPGWDENRVATWPPSTATLLTAGDGAVLVDALMTLDEGTALAAWVGVVPEPMEGDELVVGPEVAHTVVVGGSDVPVPSVVHVPEHALVVSGDLENPYTLWVAAHSQFAA